MRDTGVTTTKFNFVKLTEQQITARAMAAGFQERDSLRADGMTENDAIYLLFGRLDGSIGTGYQFVKLGAKGIGRYRGYVKNVSVETGKMATVVEFGQDSEIAFYEFGKRDTFFHDSEKKSWIGGVVCRGAYQRHDGTWLTVTYAAAASGDAGPVDKAMCRAATGRAVFLWLMQVRAIDLAEKAEIERA